MFDVFEHLSPFVEAVIILGQQPAPHATAKVPQSAVLSGKMAPEPRVSRSVGKVR